MYINRFFTFCITALLLSGCATTTPDTDMDWFDEYGTLTTGNPIQMQYGRLSDAYGTDITDQDATHHMAVMLPLSGPNATVGKTIRTSVEAAILQSAPDNLSVAFYDTANGDISSVIENALANNPDIIVGPVFANNARILRESKPENIPVLSFTSDATAVGNGVMTMALMPTNSVELIVREMKSDGANKFIIMAPDTSSGRLMAGTAKSAAEQNNLTISGIFYYNEKDSDSIKNATISASMHNARTLAHTRAREVLSDILTNERLTAIEKSNLTYQLEKLSKSDTVGTVPYDAILFLGSGDDTKTLASFLRYYNVGARDAKFYGTTMWDGSNIASDFTMSGAKFATMPDIDENFSALYEQISGAQPNRLATFGYDATNMAIGMIYSDKSNAAHLLNPSGYMGTDGLFRMNPTGTSERALRIVELDGSGAVREVKPAATNFIVPIYNIEQRHISPADAMELETDGIDPDDYIRLPERLQNKYRSKTIGAHTNVTPTIQKSALIAILPEDDSDVIEPAEYTPIKLESVKRSYIDEYEIYED